MSPGERQAGLHAVPTIQRGMRADVTTMRVLADDFTATNLTIANNACDYDAKGGATQSDALQPWVTGSTLRIPAFSADRQLVAKQTVSGGIQLPGSQGRDGARPTMGTVRSRSVQERPHGRSHRAVWVGRLVARVRGFRRPLQPRPRLLVPECLVRGVQFHGTGRCAVGAREVVEATHRRGGRGGRASFCAARLVAAAQHLHELSRSYGFRLRCLVIFGAPGVVIWVLYMYIVLVASEAPMRTSMACKTAHSTTHDHDQHTTVHAPRRPPPAGKIIFCTLVPRKA